MLEFLGIKNFFTEKFFKEFLNFFNLRKKILGRFIYQNVWSQILSTFKI